VDFAESVLFLSTLRRFAPERTPDRSRVRFREFLDNIGNPQKGQCYIHVVGTNGKGSTCTFLTSALLEMGYSVGTYLSPYVFYVEERIQYNNIPISQADFARLTTQLQPLIESTPLLEFEAKTALAFLYFAEKKPDFIVLEAGIGGKWDSTNVIDAPLVAVITSIGLDHQNLLGDTRTKIANEKVGIVKPGTLACVTPIEESDTEAHPVIAMACASAGVPLRHAPAYTGELSLRGTYQEQNAGTAVAALLVLQEAGKIAFTHAQLAVGLAKANLPGRFQIHSESEKTLILDVAHNVEGASVLGQSLEKHFPNNPKTFVIGMSQNHDPTLFLEILRPQINQLIVTEPNFRPLPAESLAQTARVLGLLPRLITPTNEAIAQAWEECKPGEVVVVTGSFYTVGETPKYLRATPKDLRR
jgi:dihydrofolate synthase / folylpolyglutamate synthase